MLSYCPLLIFVLELFFCGLETSYEERSHLKKVQCVKNGSEIGRLMLDNWNCSSQIVAE